MIQEDAVFNIDLWLRRHRHQLIAGDYQLGLQYDWIPLARMLSTARAHSADPLMWSFGLSILGMAESTLARIRSKWCSLAQDDPTRHLDPVDFRLNSVVLAFLHVHIVWYRYKMTLGEDDGSIQEVIVQVESAYGYLNAMIESGSLRYWCDSRALLICQGAIMLQEVYPKCREYERSRLDALSQQVFQRVSQLVGTDLDTPCACVAGAFETLSKKSTMGSSACATVIGSGPANPAMDDVAFWLMITATLSLPEPIFPTYPRNLA